MSAVVALVSIMAPPEAESETPTVVSTVVTVVESTVTDVESVLAVVSASLLQATRVPAIKAKAKNFFMFTN